MSQETNLDYIVEINIATDAMKANLRIIPSMEKDPEDVEVSFDIVFKKLNEAKIVYGVDNGAISRIIDKKIFNQWTCIAKGTDPVHGTDGNITLSYLNKNNSHKTQSEHSKVNLRELNLIHNVKKDEVLAEINPPKPGVNGMNIHGKEVPAKKGKSVLIPKGQNTSLSEDGLTLRSNINGLVELDNKRLHVQPVYEVDMVDASIGNIHFTGSVIVNGEIGDGYEIHAGGDIYVAMSVGVAILEAEGSIHISGGILGSQKGKIRAGQDVRIKFIQDAQVTAGGTIIVDDYIRGSEVASVGPIIVKNKEGSIAGSIISSESWIYTTIVGSKHAGNRTNLIVGHDPNLSKKKESLADDIHNMIRDSLKLYASLVKLRHLKQKNELTEQQKNLYAKIISALTTLRANMESLDEQISLIDEKISNVYSGFIYTPGTLMEGATIQIGRASLNIESLKTATQYSLVDGALVESTFTMKPEIMAILEKA